MQQKTITLSIILLMFLGSCNDCTTCKPFTEEPFINLKFYHISDSTLRPIIIDSINHVYTKEFRYFKDTTAEFRFPLNTHADTSTFLMSYRNADTLEDSLTNTITLAYEREFVRRDDNYIVVRLNILGLESDFSGTVLSCKDSTQCISNEAIGRIYN